MSRPPAQTPAQHARIAVVIVTYNSAEVLRGCLASLSAGADGAELCSVVVADNASSDDSLAIAKEHTDLPVNAVQVGYNSGYAKAINVGMGTLALDTFDAVFVMNPDCRLTPGALARLAEALDRPRCGIAVPRMTNPDGSLQPSLRRRPTLLRTAAEALVGGGRAGRIGTLGELITDRSAYETPQDVAWGTGAALLLSTAAIREIGDWDESFLLYSEETDYQLRAGDLGWKVRYVPSAVVEHIGGEAGTNPMLASLLCVNRVRLFRKRNGALASAVFFLIVALGEMVRAAAGRRTSRAAFTALVRPSRRVTSLPN
jgi:GT2 family glycosyltransferase